MKARRFGNILLGAVLALALGTQAMAQRNARSHASATAPTAAPPPASAIGEAAANAGTVGVISGGVDGTYVRIAADLASVLDDGNRLRVLPVIGKGSVQNVADILYLHGIDIGIVQSDALAYIERHNLYPGVQQLVDYIAKLYEEEVHVLARKDITQLADLAHQKVNVDVRGSGTAMTASVLFDSLGIPVEATNDDQDAALEKLRRGDIAAIVYVVGKPARLFTPLPADSGLHFLAIPLKDALLDTYLPAQLRHADYPTLVPDGKPVDTVAVGAVMAVYQLAAEHRPLCQGGALRGRIFLEVPPVPAAAAAPEMEGGQSRGPGARLDTVPAGAGLAAAPCRGQYKRRHHAGRLHDLPRRHGRPGGQPHRRPKDRRCSGSSCNGKATGARRADGRARVWELIVASGEAALQAGYAPAAPRRTLLNRFGMSALRGFDSPTLAALVVPAASIGCGSI